jgi:hypothetical protein
MPSPSCPVPGNSLTCTACGGDTSSDGGGVLTVSIRNVEGKLEVKHLRYHRACVPPDDRQVHLDLEKLGNVSTQEPPRGTDRLARTQSRAPKAAEEKVDSDGVVTLVTPEGAPRYRLVAEFEPARGFATVVYNEVHAMMGVNMAISAAQVTQRILDNGEYTRLAPKAAASKDPVKPVTVTLEKWVAEGKVTRG